MLLSQGILPLEGATAARYKESRLTEIPSYLKGELVSFVVGEQRERYHVHANLFKCSTYLMKKIYHNGEETSCLANSDVQLPLSTAEFEILLSWLYRRTIPPISNTSAASAKKVNRYLAFYINASQWGMHDLQDAVMDIIRAYFASNSSAICFPESSIKILSARLDVDSPLRRYIVDVCAHKIYQNSIVGRRIFIKSQLKHGNLDFAMDLYERLLIKENASGPGNPNQGAKNAYHHHLPSSPKYKSEPSEDPKSTREEANPPEVSQASDGEKQAGKKLTLKTPPQKSTAAIAHPNLERSLRFERAARKAAVDYEDWKEEEEGDSDSEDSEDSEDDDDKGTTWMGVRSDVW